MLTRISALAALSVLCVSVVKSILLEPQNQHKIFFFKKSETRAKNSRNSLSNGELHVPVASGTWPERGRNVSETLVVVIVLKHFRIALAAGWDDFTDIFAGVFDELAATGTNGITVIAH